MSKLSHSLNMAARFTRLGIRHPGVIKSRVRALYRNKYGIPKDRNDPEGYSAPPTRLNFDLTRRCNLRCLTCMQNRHTEDENFKSMGHYSQENELPLSTWIGLLDQFTSFKPSICLFGGEPTLFNGVIDLIDAAKSKGFPVQITTNGTKLAKMAEDLVRTGIDWVTVSLDGPEEYHNTIRGRKDAFSLTTEGIRALVEARKRLGRAAPIVGVNTVISKTNVDVVDQVAPIVAELGVDLLQFSHTNFNRMDNIEKHNRIFPSSFNKDEYTFELIAEPSIMPGECYESEVAEADIPKINAAIQRAREASAGKLHFYAFPNLPEDLVGTWYLDFKHDFGQLCQKLWGSSTILPDGTVQSCFHIKNGNITEQPFMDIWNGPAMRHFRKIIAKRLLPGCARCCSRKFVF